MGSAIALFAGAQALRVPRSRFAPVKKNSDLLAVWSDVYELTPEYRLRLSPARNTYPPRRPPLVSLDDRYYALIADMQQRFPYGPPSMLQCTELRVQGDFYFGKDVVLEGAVTLVNDSEAPLFVPDGAHITGK